MPLERVVINKDLIKIKDLVCRREVVSIDSHDGIQISEISKKVDELEGRLRVRKSRSATVFRRKKQIAYVVKKHGQVSSTQVAKELNISRNRANEYLKDMERANLLRSTKRGKVAFYMSKVGA